MARAQLFEAVLLGVAAGDALGRPYEVEGAGPASEWIAPGALQLRGIEVSGRYAYSDDTETTIILAKSVARSCGFNPHDFAALLAAEADVENPLRGYGTAVASVVLGLRRGVPWWATARSLYGGQGSMGNGAAVRVAPIALYYLGNRRAVEVMSVAQALVTHANPVAAEAARIMALAYHYVLEGDEPARVLRRLSEEAEVQPLKSKMNKAVSLLGTASPRDVAIYIGNSALAYESVPAALLVAAVSGCDPFVALHAAISVGGDVDSIASMAVGLAAACRGSLGRLEPYARLVEGYEEVRRVARELYDAKIACA